MSFTFTAGDHKGKSPDKVPKDYLLMLYRRLNGSPAGSKEQEAWEASAAELATRALVAGEPMPELPETPAGNPTVFQRPPAIPAAVVQQRIDAAKRNGHTASDVGPRGAERNSPTATVDVMPCGHPTSDLEAVEGNWRRQCKGCARLQAAADRLMAAEDAKAVLLDFEAQIRGYGA